MFGLVPKGIWHSWFEPGELDEANRMPLNTNSLLLEGHGRLVLIEVGIGDKLSPKEQAIYALEKRSVLDALHEADCRPEDVTDVILTHLHFDHAGGLTRAAAPGSDSVRLSFPNARIHVQKQEWEDAVANRSVMHKTYLPSHLTAEVRDRLVLADTPAAYLPHAPAAPPTPTPGPVPETEILPGVFVWRTPGHTWGQQAVRFASSPGGAGAPKHIVYVPDVMPTRWHARPTTNMAYDVEPYVSMLERARLMERAAREHWTLVLDHDPGGAVFGAEHDAKSGYRLVDA